MDKIDKQEIIIAMLFVVLIGIGVIIGILLRS